MHLQGRVGPANQINLGYDKSYDKKRHVISLLLMDGLRSMRKLNALEDRFETWIELDNNR